MLLQSTAITYLQTTTSTEIAFKVSAVSLTQASTNIQPMQCLGKLQTRGWYGKAQPNLQSPWTERITEARPVTANLLFHITWSRMVQKSQILLYFCPLVPWGKPTTLVTAHWTTHSRLHTPHGWIQESSSIPISQHPSDEASHGVSVPVSGFIWRCQISSSNPVYLLSHWPLR